MSNNETGFKIYGKVISKETGDGIPDLTVKAIDKDLLFDDLLGATKTDNYGRFEIFYDNEDFQELFFDKKPDIYIKIKSQSGNVIYTTKDKVRYGAGKTEEFVIEIENFIQQAVQMEWNVKKSIEIKEKIASNEELMKQLSSLTQGILEKYKVKLDGISYVFEPRVFTMDASEAPEIWLKSRKAMTKTYIEEYDVLNRWSIDISRYNMKCLPTCGPKDPWSLRILEDLRFSDYIKDDPVPVWNEASAIPITLPKPIPSEYLINRIVADEKLLIELSESIFNVLHEQGITFEENEGCVFTPVAFDTPVYAQKVGRAESIEMISGFGPQVIDQPESYAQNAIRIDPFPGIIEFDHYGPIPGLIWDWWWWVGIPAPELLVALDKYREFSY